jgi:hypothetical protein
MSMQIEIPDKFFTNDEKEKLKVLFEVNTEEGFEDALCKIILAALDEYRDMFLGMGLPSRADEIREYRLYYLIKRFFNGRIPDELEVSSMFQLPETRSKSLILYVLTRFHFDLREEILNTLREIIKGAEITHDGVEYRVFIQSKNMVEELDRIIGRGGVRYKKMSKARNESNMYLIVLDSYEVICRYLGIKPPK